MRLGVIRCEPSREPPSPALLQHVQGKSRPPSAMERFHLGVDVECHRPASEAFDAAVADARAVVANKRGGRPPKMGSSWLFSGCPDTNDVHLDDSTIPPDAAPTLAEGRPWTLADCRRFHDRARDLLIEACPGAARHLTTSLHLDEKTVHVHAEMLAFTGGRVGNQGIREAMARLAPGFAAANEEARERLLDREIRQAEAGTSRRRRWIDKGPDHVYVSHQEQMRLIHDLYAERFADFGIERGERGRKKYRKAVDQAKALDAKWVAATAAEDREQTARDSARSALERVVRYRGEAESEVYIRDDARAARGREEVELGRAQEDRKRAEDAAAAAREQLEADAARGTTGWFGKRARHGRKLREEDEAVMNKLRRERDTAKAERDRAKEDLREFETTKTALNDERYAHQVTKTELDKALSQLRKMPGKVRNAWWLGLSSGLRVVGALLERALPERARTTDFWKPLLSDFQKGNFDEIRALMSISDRQQLVGDVLVGADAEIVEDIRCALHREVVAPSPSRAHGAAQRRLRPREGGMER